MNYGSTFFMLWPGSELFLSTSNHSNSVTVREKKTQTHFMSDVEIDGRNNNKSESSKFLFLFDYVWWSSKLIFCYTQTGNCQVVICSEWMCETSFFSVNFVGANFARPTHGWRFMLSSHLMNYSMLDVASLTQCLSIKRYVSTKQYEDSSNPRHNASKCLRFR